jgi:hypothetical protein
MILKRLIKISNLKCWHTESSLSWNWSRQFYRFGFVNSHFHGSPTFGIRNRSLVWNKSCESSFQWSQYI